MKIPVQADRDPDTGKEIDPYTDPGKDTDI